MNLFGIVGLIGSGKGTVGEILRDTYGFKLDSFAAPVKDAVAVIFGWPRHLLEGDTKESREFREAVDPFWSERLGYEVTPRLMLQKFGTEAVRNAIGQSIWLSSLERRVDPMIPTAITDMRFPNEIDFTVKNNGFVVWVRRDPLPDWFEIVSRLSLPEAEDWMHVHHPEMHVSEFAWVGEHVDFVIENNGTLEDLHNSVARMIEESYVESAFRQGVIKEV